VVNPFAPMTSPLWVAALAGLLAAAVVDFRRRIIPNRVVLLIAACAIAIRLLTEPGTLVSSIFLAVAVLLILGVLARRELIGAGDAKLIAAVTLMVRPSEVAALFLVIALSGGLLSVMYLVTRSRTMRAALHESIPYGVAVFVGTACIVGLKAFRWLHATS
jgi:prepilin peptidase CpaA